MARTGSLGAAPRAAIARVRARLAGTRASSAGFVTLGVAVICTLVASAIMVGKPVTGGVVDLLSGRSWLTRTDQGLVMLANGSSGRIDVLFDVEGTEGHDLEVVQVDGHSFLIDRTTGEVRSLDVADLEVGASRRLAAPDGLDVVPAGQNLVVVRRNEGVVEVQSPLDGEILAQADVGSHLTRAVVDRAGKIWVADTEAGVAVPLQLVGRRLKVGDSVRVGGGRAMTLALADGSPLVVNAETRSLVRIVDGEADEPVRLPLQDGETTEVARTSTGGLVSLSVNETGDLIIVKGDQARRVKLGRKGHELGEPVVFDGRVFLPDYSVGEVLVIGSDGRPAGPGIRLGGAKPGRFSVRAEGGRLWVDDPDSNDAFVLGPNDASFRRIDKGERDVPSNKDEPSVLAPPKPPPPPPAPPAPDPATAAPPQPGQGPQNGAVVPPRPEPPTVPGAPPTVTGRAGDQQVILSWGAAPPNGAAIETYEVSWEPTGGADGAEPGQETFTGTQLQATIGGLRNGATYVFSVRALNRVGGGPATASDPVTPDGNVPSAPDGVTATGGIDGTITVSWNAADANGASPVESYTVTATDGAGGTVEAAAGVTATDTQVGTANRLALGGGYQFTVTATNRRGITSEPSAASAPLTLAAPAEAPGGPGAAPAGDGALTVTWAEPALNGGALDHYEVTADNGAGTQDVPAGAGTAAQFTGLQNGTTYTFTIRAVTTANGQTLTGAQSSASGTPGRSPEVFNMAANASGTRVNWSVEFNGHNSGDATCEVLANGASVYSGPCSQPLSGGFDGAYSTTYTLQAFATNSFGGPVPSNTASARTADPPPPPRTVTVGKGSARPADGQCWDPSCAWVRVTLSGFTPGTRVQIQCHETNESPFATGSVTIGGDGTAVAQPCFFGYPGRQVWASAGGVTSSRITW